jgi:hypothetical protein
MIMLYNYSSLQFTKAVILVFPFFKTTGLRDPLNNISEFLSSIFALQIRTSLLLEILQLLISFCTEMICFETYFFLNNIP